MAYAGGLGSQIGWAPEVTYGTASTPTAWLEAKKQSLDLKVEHMMSPALQSGLRVQRADRFVVNKKGVTGDIELDIMSNNMARWLIYAMGDSRSMSSIKSGSTAYTYAMQLGDPTSLGAMTIQTGISDIGGNVRRMDATGCFITDFTLSNQVDGLLEGKFSVDGRDYTPSASAVTSASYSATSEVLSFAGGTISIGGSNIPVRSYDLTVKHGFDTGRYQIQNNTLKSQPVINALDDITLKVSLEFGADSPTWATNDLMTKYRAGTTLSNVQGQWTGTTAITGGTYPALTALVPKAVITSATPQFSGPELVILDVELRALYDGNNQPLQLTYVTNENLS